MRHPACIFLIAVFCGFAAACSSEKTTTDGARPDAVSQGGTFGNDAALISDAVSAGGQDTGTGSGGKGGNSRLGEDAGVSDGQVLGGARDAAGDAGVISSRDAGTGGTGGQNTGGQGGAAGGRRSSTTAGVAGSATGGQNTGVTGGAVSGPKILWTDSIQSKPSPWGFDGLGIEHPIGTTVEPKDSNGVNLSVVPDPLGGTGLALRHYATFDPSARSQAGLYGDVNTIFGKQAKSPEGVWIAQEWYFPEALSANGDAYPWINLWDFHSVDQNRGNRWATSPGLMLAQDGSMKVRWEWGGPVKINKASERSAVAMPVGRWFDIEVHYQWIDSPTGTITLWIDGQLAIEQTGVQTRATSNQIAETYFKLYGSTQGRTPWAPTPSLKYTRNVRVAGERIWRGPTPSR